MAESQLAQYLPVLMLGVLAVVFSFGMLVMSVVLGKRGKRPPIKDTPYECGMVPIGEGSTRLSMRFYLVAMLFILFDMEAIFLYPWVVVYRELNRQMKMFPFIEMAVFVILILAGFFYIWKKGALDWATSDVAERKR
jgi:NADH-quinone oxidoreductase subunit A